MKRFLNAYALVFFCAFLGANAAPANAQLFRFGWFQRCSTCQPCSACQSTTASAQSCQTCPGGVCLVDPVESVEIAPGCETCSGETCESCESCDDCPLSELESELVREAIRVRGQSRRILKFDFNCNRRAQYNTSCQATYCRLGHYTGDSNEIAGVGYTSARAAIAGWLNSPQHRAILLRGNYTRVGACVRRGRDGRLYWTMNFGF